MIKIISGTYGHRKGNRIIPKNSNSAPFEADPAEEERLVELGIAEKVEVEVEEAKTAAESISESDNEPTTPDFNSLTVENLKKYAEEHNISLPKNARKAEIISIINAAENAADNEIAAGDDDMPNFQAQMPE